MDTCVWIDVWVAEWADGWLTTTTQAVRHLTAPDHQIRESDAPLIGRGSEKLELGSQPTIGLPGAQNVPISGLPDTQTVPISAPIPPPPVCACTCSLTSQRALSSRTTTGSAATRSCRATAARRAAVAMSTCQTPRPTQACCASRAISLMRVMTVCDDWGQA
eukprot:362502-Chlamydomonas_euryale.AAC.5